MNSKSKDLAKKCFCDQDGKVALGQAPNWQIIAAFIFYFGHRLLIDYSINNLLYALFILFFTFWAYEELIYGINYFRRFLGLASLALIAFLLVNKF